MSEYYFVNLDKFKDAVEEINKQLEDKANENWNGTCSCTGCYWNMWHPNSKYNNNEASKVCVSESLDELTMTPNTTECEGYYSFKEACGMTKEENK